ncbi:hypothetical protein C0991_003359 [Blastosporella zonata]|nr:hypothetical protein C0991_003359 [Blastosporella zonata]
MTRNVFVNHHAHVPILILETREDYGSVSVDININNASGAQGAEVIKGYLAKMPALRPLVLLLKGFLRQRKLNDASKGGLGSYALVCLCIHFLQTNPSKRPQEYIDKPMESESLGFLLTDFMFYYGLTFSYKTSCISAAASPGAVLSKLEESGTLSIRCLLHPGPSSSPYASESTLTVLLENEIAKSVSKTEAFLQVFKDAYAILLQLNMADKEMLGQIIRVDKKFIEQRTRLAGLFVNEPSVPRTHPSRGYYENSAQTHHPLPARPAVANIPRAPRTWKETPLGPSRMRHPLPTAPKLK